MAVTFYPNYIHYAAYDASAEPSITGETYESSGGETSGAAYDLLDNSNNNVVTIDTNAQSTNPIIDIDLTANITAADFALIDNSNLITAVADTTIKYGGTTQALSTAYQGALGSAMTSVSIGANEADTGSDGADGIALFLFDGTRTASGFEFYFDYDAVVLGQYAADMTAGEVAIGVSFTPAYSPELDQVFGYQYKHTSVSESLGGMKYAVKRGEGQRMWRVHFLNMSSAEKASMETVFDVTGGNTYPFWIDLGEAATPQLYYVRFMTDLDFRERTYDSWSLTFTIEEEL